MASPLASGMCEQAETQGDETVPRSLSLSGSAGCTGSRDDDNESVEEKDKVKEVEMNLGATSSGARAIIEQLGVTPYHKAVYGPHRPAEEELKTRAESRLVDVSLALNCWMPPAAQTRANDKVRTSVIESHAARREAAEAERLAAAADARTFFAEQAVKRTAEQTMDGLALHEAVRYARTRPWDVWTRRELTNQGIDADAAECAVREWEPQLFDDPIDSRHVAGCWAAETDARERGLESLVKEGWLWVPGVGQKWVMLRKNKGLLWSNAPRDFILGMILFPFLRSFERARDDECSIEFTRNRAGATGVQVRLKAETPEEAHLWFLHIDAQFNLYKVNNGIGHLEAVQVLQPSAQVIIKLPAVDLNTDIQQRAVIFHVKEGQDFQEGDLLCEIERAEDIQPNVDVFARFSGKVIKVSKSRKINEKDTKYSYFAVDDVILHLLKDPDWVSGERFLPRSEPTDDERQFLAARTQGLERVEHEELDIPSSASRTASRAASRMSGRISLKTARSNITSRLSTGREVGLEDVADLLVATNYNNHADEFWTRNALLLDTLDHAPAPAPHSNGPVLSRGGSRTTSRPSTRSAKDGVSNSRGGTTPGGRRVTGTSRRHVEGVETSGVDGYYLHTSKSRYSSSALAAASKILLQT